MGTGRTGPSWALPVSPEHLLTRFEMIATTSPDAIVCSDADGTITIWNPAAERMFGYPASEMLGANISRLMPDRMACAHALGLTRSARAKRPPRRLGTHGELMGRRSSGEEFPIEITLSAWSEGADRQFSAIIRDISERRTQEQRLEQLALYDQLTGLPNRALFRQRLQRAIRQVRAGRALSAAVLMLDLDGFKDVNDSLGHGAGDELLQLVSRRLLAAVPANATVARLSGDEFAILLPNAGAREASSAAQRVLDAFAAPFTIEDHAFYISTCVGAALAPRDGDTADLLVSNADLALYTAKEEASGAFRMFESRIRAQFATRKWLERDIRRAFEGGELVLHYQPQVSLSDGTMVGGEALLRWEHPERGLVGPGDFLSALEASALSIAVGRWVIETACRDAGRWLGDGLPPCRVSVNLFASQLRSGNLINTVLDALARHNVPASTLELEITETIALKQDESLIAQLVELRALGVGIVFDDFGTGFASLSMLKQFPLTRLKIDRGFVRGLESSANDRAIVQAVLAIAESFRLEVIAEGVETTLQESFLRRHGCALGQGYLYSAALPPEEFAHCLAVTRAWRHETRLAHDNVA